MHKRIIKHLSIITQLVGDICSMRGIFEFLKTKKNYRTQVNLMKINTISSMALSELGQIQETFLPCIVKHVKIITRSKGTSYYVKLIKVLFVKIKRLW